MVTSTITTVFSAFSSFGLAAVSAWFASERIVFNRHKGRKWLAEILDDISDRLGTVTGYGWMKKAAPERSKTAFSWSARVVRRASIPLRRMRTMFGGSSDSTGRADSVESIPPPYTSPTIPPSAVIMAPRSGIMVPTKSVVHFQLGREDERTSGEDSGRPSDASPIASPIIPPSTPELVTEVSVARARFMNLVRSAIMVNRLIGVGDEVKAKVSRSLTDGKAAGRKSAGPATMPRGSRVAGLVPRLQNMTPTQDIAAHAALVRHMQVSVKPTALSVPVIDGALQFSPDGKFLATSSWDRTSVIFHVGVCHVYLLALQKLSDFTGTIHFPSYAVTPHWICWSSRMVWVPQQKAGTMIKPSFRSPSGNLIMTKLPRTVKIWTQDGVCRKTIERYCPVQSITWLPNGEGKLAQRTFQDRLMSRRQHPAFLSVEESSIVRLVR